MLWPFVDVGPVVSRKDPQYETGLSRSVQLRFRWPI